MVYTEKHATIHLIDHVTLIFNQTLLRTEDFLSVEHETEARFQIRSASHRYSIKKGSVIARYIYSYKPIGSRSTHFPHITLLLYSIRSIRAYGCIPYTSLNAETLDVRANAAGEVSWRE
jgi:hypothetical protein